MAVLTFGVSTVIAVTGASAATAAPALAGTLTGIVTISASPEVGGVVATVAGSAGAGAVVGAISGTAENGSAIIGAVLGSASSAAVTCSSAGFAGAVSGGLTLGPLGWMVLGAEYSVEDIATFDCWKPVLRDNSDEPSRGKLLKDVIDDWRIKKVIIKDGKDGQLPQVSLTNVWDETFNIEYLVLPTNNQLVAHAVRV